MPKVEPIKVLTVDDVPMNVAELSDAVKQLVTIFDDWNQQEADARSHLMMVSAAKDTLSRQIIGQIRADKQAAEEAAAPVAAAPAVDEVAPPAEVVHEADVSADEVPEDAVIVTGDAAE